MMFAITARAAALCALLSYPIWAQMPATAPSSKSGLDLQAIDKSVNPCDDFYQYACGSWLKNNQVPDEETRHGRFDELHDRNEATLHRILEKAEKDRRGPELDQKIGGFFASCMNESEIQQRGTAPLKAELDRIRGISNKRELLDEVAHLHDLQVGVFFDFGSMPDPKDTRNMIASIDQGGIGLPERDYYFRTDEKSIALRQKYVLHIQRMLQLSGVSESDAASASKRIMELETALAKSSLDVTSQRDPQNVVHVVSVAELKKMAPGFDWEEYFSKVGAPQFSKLNVGEPDFFKAFADVTSTTDLNELRSYLVWQYLHASAVLLPKSFVDENFSFYRATLAGAKEQKPRWKRCVAATDAELGDALGRRFVDETFGQEGKDRTLQMVKAIEAEMESDINSIEWMSAETKKQALVKLHGVINKIGYPEKWRDYSTVKIVPEDYFGNWYRANEYESKRTRDKIGKPTDKMEWDYTAPTVNAGYDPLQNTINFPAGILQPPFFSNQATDAVNYGAIGMVIGHELTHGFDDEGRQFDADGNLRDWWQKSDEDQFVQKAECLSNEAGHFEPIAGHKVNGKLTLGENTADNGGLRLAYMALMQMLEKKGISTTAESDGYTPAQQFFLGEAQVWCENIRPEQAIMYIQTDPHPPNEFRVNGVVSNMPEFQNAFSCKAGDKMYQANACRVW